MNRPLIQINNIIREMNDEEYSIWLSEYDDKVKEYSESIRIDRNKKLSDTDWVVIKAVETNSSLPPDWISYRQALRDISQQSGFPWDIEWPIEPKYEKIDNI